MNIIINLESRSMRENLIVYGIPEKWQVNDEHGRNSEDCEALVKQLFTSQLDIDGNHMLVDRAHRLGSNRAKKPRAIVVKFN